MTPIELANNPPDPLDDHIFEWVADAVKALKAQDSEIQRLQQQLE